MNTKNISKKDTTNINMNLDHEMSSTHKNLSSNISKDQFDYLKMGLNTKRFYIPKMTNRFFIKNYDKRDFHCN